MRLTLLCLLVPVFLFSQETSTQAPSMFSESNKLLKLSSPQSIDDNNDFKIKFEKGQVLFSDRGNMLQKSPFYSQEIQVFGGGGDDNLTVDLHNADNVDIIYDGQNNFQGTQGDILEIWGPPVEQVDFDFYNKTDGKIYVGNNTIEFLGLEPIVLLLQNNDLTLNIPDNPMNLTTSSIGDDMTPNDGSSIFESTFAESTTFLNPSETLIVNGGSGDDVINFNGLDADVITPDIEFDGGGGTNTLVVDAQGTVPFMDATTIIIPGFYNISYTNFTTVTIINNSTASITISPVSSGAEDNTDGSFSLTSSTALPSNTTISLLIQGAATEGTDYTSIGSSIVFPPGITNTAITVDVIGDDEDEIDENVTITLLSTDNQYVTIGAQSAASILIIDDDERPVITADQTFSIIETADNTTVVGTVLATDTDAGTVFQDWMIVSGNDSQDGDSEPPFSIDPSTGIITVNDVDELSNSNPMYALEVTVSDGTNTSDPQIVTILLIDFNIPTLSEWGMIILFLGLVIVSLIAIKERRWKLEEITKK